MRFTATFHVRRRDQTGVSLTRRVATLPLQASADSLMIARQHFSYTSVTIRGCLRSWGRLPYLKDDWTCMRSPLLPARLYNPKEGGSRVEQKSHLPSGHDTDYVTALSLNVLIVYTYITELSVAGSNKYGTAPRPGILYTLLRTRQRCTSAWWAWCLRRRREYMPRVPPRGHEVRYTSASCTFFRPKGRSPATGSSLLFFGGVLTRV